MFTVCYLQSRCQEESLEGKSIHVILALFNKTACFHTEQTCFSQLLIHEVLWQSGTKMFSKGVCKFVEEKLGELLDPEMSTGSRGPLLLVSSCPEQYMRQKTGFPSTKPRRLWAPVTQQWGCTPRKTPAFIEWAEYLMPPLSS